MHWAPPLAGAAVGGRVLADRRTAAFSGRANHSHDALRVSSARPVSSSRLLRAANAQQDSPPLFYYEALIISTAPDEDNDNNDNGDSGGDATNGSNEDAAAAVDTLELQVLLARASAAGNVQRSGASRTPLMSQQPPHHHHRRHPPSHTRSYPQLYVRMPWRERARRVVHANLQRECDIAEEDYENELGENEVGENELADAERMELDSGDDDRGFQRIPNHVGNGHTASSSRDQQRAQLLSLSSAGSSNPRVHYAFTLSSRTLQQIRSRNERRQLRRQQEKQRFNHRVAVGFLFAAAPPSASPSSRGGHGVATLSSSSHPSAGASNCMHPLLRKPERECVGLEDLGRDAFSLAYHGRTGCVTSNGRTFLECDTFGAGDVVGCGVLLDTKTFFFTLNGRLLGMLAATDVHHLDDFVDDSPDDREGSAAVDSSGSDGGFDSDDIDDSDDNDNDNEASNAHSGRGDGHSPLFEDVLYPAMSLHGPGECASANFDTFRFDLAAFARQVQKERQHALQLEVASARKDFADTDDRAIDQLVGDYFLHCGYREAFEALQRCGRLRRTDKDDADSRSGRVDVHMNDDGSDDYVRGSDLSTLSAASKARLELRHSVRQHVYDYKTQSALATLRVTLRDELFLHEASTATRRHRKVLFYARVLCVVDALVGRRQWSPSAPTNANADATVATDGDKAAWNVEDAILCAQEQFASYSTNSQGLAPVASEADDELAVVMSLLLYERLEDVPASSVARKFLSHAFREHVADELNLLVLSHSKAQPRAPSTTTNNKARARPKRTAAASDAPTLPVARSSSSSSALQSFLVELNTLQSQCLRNGCRVFPGNHTVSGVGSGKSRRKSRRRHHGQHPSASGGGRAGVDNDGDDEEEGDNDEQMLGAASSSGSAMSSSSSISEIDDDDDEEEEEEEE